MDKACKDCAYWERKPKPESLGVCRVLPPTIEGWPTTSEHDWCGHWNGLEPAKDPVDIPPLQDSVCRYMEMRRDA